MRIAIASDHAGFELKESVKAYLKQHDYEVTDLGPDSDESVDYPTYAAAAARKVASGEADNGIVVCGSGVGVAIAANKVDGVRAVNAHDSEEAILARQHNNANVLTLAGRRLAAGDANQIVSDFLATDFEGGRHQRRIDQISSIEKESC